MYSQGALGSFRREHWSIFIMVVPNILLTMKCSHLSVLTLDVEVHQCHWTVSSSTPLLGGVGSRSEPQKAAWGTPSGGCTPEGVPPGADPPQHCSWYILTKTLCHKTQPTHRCHKKLMSSNSKNSTFMKHIYVTQREVCHSCLRFLWAQSY